MKGESREAEEDEAKVEAGKKRRDDDKVARKNDCCSLVPPSHRPKLLSYWLD